MKRTVLFSSTIAFVLALAGLSTAQTADKLIDRYKKAIGGKAVAKIQNTTMTGTMSSPDGSSSGRFTYKAVGPDQLRIEIELPEQSLSECYNGKSAWIRDKRGLRTLLGREAKGLRLRAILANSRFRDLSRHRIYAQKVTAVTIDGRPAAQLEVTMNDVSAKLLFDTSSGLLLKQVREIEQGVEEISFDGYQRVDGVMEPTRIQINRPEFSAGIIVDKVEHNRAIDVADFRYPVIEGSKPIPNVEALMNAVEANQERLEELREHYTFTESELQNKLDGKGVVKDAETRVYDVTPVAGVFVKRLVSIDGKELSPTEAEKEDRRVQKEIENALKQKEKQQRNGDDDDDITVLTFIRISEITSVRREIFRGQEVIAFDFEPRKGFKPRNRGETIVSKLAGTVWVDENARQIARLEARLTDSFKLGGGILASIRPSTALVFEQEKVDGEIWLPSHAEVNISARVLLFAKLNRSTTVRYSNYKKHKVDSDYKLEKPKPEEKPRVP